MSRFGFYPQSMCDLAAAAVRGGNPGQVINGIKASLIYQDCLLTQAQQAAVAAGALSVQDGSMATSGGATSAPLSMTRPVALGLSLPILLGGGLLGLILLTRKKGAPAPAPVAGYGRARRGRMGALSTNRGSIVPFVLGAGAVWYLFFKGQTASAASTKLPI